MKKHGFDLYLLPARMAIILLAFLFIYPVVADIEHDQLANTGIVLTSIDMVKPSGESAILPVTADDFSIFLATQALSLTSSYDDALNLIGSANPFTLNNVSSVITIQSPISHQDIKFGEKGTSGDDIISVSTPLNVTASSSANGGGISGNWSGNTRVDESVTSTAKATGVTAAGGQDTIGNSSTITVDADSHASVIDVMFSLIDSINTANVPIEATTEAYGIRGDQGNDNLTNTGTIDISALASAEAGDFGLSLIDASPGANTRLTASARNIGMAGDDGDDTIINAGNGSIVVDATSATGNIGGLFNIVGFGLIDTAAEARSKATGINGGRGADTIRNDGEIKVTADATALYVSLRADILGLSLAHINAPLDSFSSAVGIDGGVDNDTLTNNNLIDVTALASTYPGRINITPIAVELESPSIIGSPVSEALALGMDGGDGDDTINNIDTIMGKATASTIGGVLDGTVLGRANAIAAARAEAVAIGIDGGRDNDTITNAFLIDLEASSSIVLVAVSAALDLVPVIPTAFAGADLAVAASADVTGINGGDGNDDIDNRSIIKVKSSTNVNGIKVTAKLGLSTKDTGGSDSSPKVNSDQIPQKQIIPGVGQAILPPVDGVATILPDSNLYINGTTSRLSNATGITGGDGNNDIDNFGLIESTSDAKALGVAASLSASAKILTSSLSAQNTTTGTAPTYNSLASSDDIFGIQANTITLSSAAGIITGDGIDSIYNKGKIDVKAFASADDIAGKLNIAIPSDAISLFIPTPSFLMDSSASTDAFATGIEAGNSDDEITNDFFVQVLAGADALSVSGALDTQIVIPLDFLIFDMSADTNADTFATAIGIIGDSSSDDIATLVGSDIIKNNAMIEVTANATSSSWSVVASLGGVVTGNAVSLTQAIAMGIDGGGKGDDIDNNGTLTTFANAKTNGVSLEGIIGLGASIGNIAIIPRATATAVDGGDGNDDIDNSGILAATSTSTAIGVGVQLSALFSGSVGQANSNVDALAHGILGGSGNDMLTNTATGSITAKATSDSDITGVDVTLAIGASIADVSSDARSITGGIEGGGGEDTIRNHGSVTSEASANINARAISVTLLSTGYDDFLLPQGATADATGVDARAISTGISGDGGDDDILWTGLIDVDAISHADALMVATVATGASIGNADITSAAMATGVAGGDGNDLINAQGVVNADATATSADLSITVSGIAGSGGASGTSVMTLTADAIGIDGGYGDDVITISNQIHAMACANSGPDPVDDQCPPDTIVNPLIGANGISISLTHGGLQDLAVKTTATAIVAKGSAGNDMITNMSTINAHADAEGRAGTFGLTVLGGIMSKVNTEIIALATGLAGGDGVDDIVNMGTVIADAKSNTKDWSMNLVALGSSVADNTTMATALAVGIDGNDGNDDIRNHGQVMTDADAIALASVIDINATFDPLQLYGVSTVGSSSTRADAIATGLLGGAGEDYILLTGSVYSDASSDVSDTDTTYKSIGAVIANGGSDSRASAIGIDGGEGRDQIDSRSIVSVIADARSGSSNVNITGAGTSTVEAETRVVADATGIIGGKDGDTINISGTIVATSHASTLDKAWSLTLAGTGGQNAALVVDGIATGARGGEGVDVLLNATGNFITPHATALGSSNSVNIDLAGVTNGNANMDVTATVIGLRGDAGGDGLMNLGVIDGVATSTATFSNVDFTFAGVAASNLGNADTVADTWGVGMAGDDGDDLIRNDGSIFIDTTATVGTSKDSTISIFGSAGTSAILTASPMSTGIDGGANDDFIENFNLIDIISTANTNLLNGSSFTFGGVASDTAQIMASSASTGINGGSGLDVIDNSDRILVLADSTMDVGSNSKVAFGVARSAGVATAVANAAGITGGDDQDAVTNQGTIDVRSVAVITSADSSYAFAGSPSANPVVAAASHALGISGGEGADQLINGTAANITVKASVRPSTTGDSRATFDFDTVSGSTTLSATATANGIKGGQGNDTMQNLGNITVVADSDASAVNTSKAGIFLGDTASSATASAVFQTYAMDAGDGNNSIANSGTLSNTLALLGLAPTVLAQSNALGGDGSIESDAFATATSTLSAVLVGLMAGSGDNTVINSSTITLLNVAQAKAKAIANGNGFDGDGSGTASVWLGANDPNDTLNSPRLLSVTGIAAGDGSNIIMNHGELIVQASPKGIASANADGDFIGSAFTVLNATVSARATGIQVGDGGNLITNESDITVLADPTALSTSTVSPGLLARATISEHATAIANSVGIQAGDGGNNIFNSGNIDVQANASATAATSTSTDATATAILTGSGDDTVINAQAGILKTTVTNVVGVGVGINVGAGNDLVGLYDTSQVMGEVLLGAGNDTIAFTGTSSFSGVIQGGNGIDTLRLDDRNTRVLSPTDFSSVERFEVNQGRLNINTNFTLPVNSELQVELYDGGHGQLDVDGQAITGVNNHLTIIAQPQTYLDGGSFDVLVGDSVSGTFATSTLPSTIFLGFNISYLPTAVRIETSTQTFASASTNETEKATAAHLDSLLPGATGDLAKILTEIQFMTDPGEVSAAFSNLNPSMYANNTLMSMGATRLFEASKYRRMDRVRQDQLSAGNSRPYQSSERIMFAYNGSKTDIKRLMVDSESEKQDRRPYGFWINAMSQRGDQNSTPGFTGFEHEAAGIAIGWDYASDNLLVGLSGNFSKTDIDMNNAAGSGGIESQGLSVYSSYFNNRWYVEGDLGYVWQENTNRRIATVGTIQQVASSNHDAEAWSVYLGGGYYFPLRNGQIGPFARLEYIHLDEDGFTESGAGAANLVVQARKTDALRSVLGLRMTGLFDLGHGSLMPEASIAWSHDFDVDDLDITSSFANTPASSFIVRGQDVEDDGAIIGVGLTYTDKSDRLGFALKYNAELRSDYDDHSILAEIRFSF